MIKVNWNSGFFSCCSVKLDNIIRYINIYKKMPIQVDSSEQFEWYKTDKNQDITYIYFEEPNNLNEIILNDYRIYIDFYHENQFTDYSNLNYDKIFPIVYKYFYPSRNIINKIQTIEEKYILDYNNICVLFYRGNDKITETKLCEYDEYLTYANLIVKNNPNIKFLIQSDETEFIEFILKLFPNNSFYFNDEIRHVKKCNNTVDKLMKESIFIFSQYYLSITIIMSKCKYIICGSGNCSIWIMLYRGNASNVYQNLDGKWIENS
jgi:hypothetical protein